MKTNNFIATAIFVATFCLMSLAPVFADQMLLAPLEIFKVENGQSEAKFVTVTVVKHKPTSSQYVVQGRVQHEDVEGVAYLEMWSIFPDGSRYFTRTLGEYGTMQKIQGTSGWREFELPFNLMNAKPDFVTLEINIFMPGKGKIQLSSLTVSDIQTSIAGEWFSASTTGKIGGILGSGCGIFGAIIGCLGGFLVPRGKGRRLVLGLLRGGAVVGILLLSLGIVALILGQPYHVWYSFALTGGIMLLVFLPLLPIINKEYAKVELRKMQVLDM